MIDVPGLALAVTLAASSLAVPAPVDMEDPMPGNAPPALDALLAMLTDRRPTHHPGDLRRLLSPGPSALPAPARTSVSATSVTPALGEDFETPDGLR